MADPLEISIRAASSGLAAQSQRMRIVSENLANAQSTSTVPGGDPFRRKTVSFEAELDRGERAGAVRAVSGQDDKAPFRLEHDPGHPAADVAGNVKLPNVNVLVELADMREANRSYEANLQVVREARELISMTIDLLRSS